MTVRYPVAASAEAALKAPFGRAVRQREAAELAGEAVAFVRELTGPTFETREAAEAAYAGKVDGPGSSLAPEDRYCDLVEIVRTDARRRAGGQAEPSFEAGRRWPKPRALLKTGWRASVGYWRIGGSETSSEGLPQARQARRVDAGQGLGAKALRAMAEQPLQPVKPQQPLDIGLFEVRPPEAPHIVMPDE